jgi:acyl carrier protein
MNIDEFIKLIEPEFDEVPAGTIKPESEFRALEGWSSMMALIVISRINKSCKVAVTAQELAQAKTIADLYNITTVKLQAAT